MEDNQSNQTEREHSGIEMTTFRPPEQATKQVGPFPGSAKRPSTDSQRSDRELDGHQVVRYIPPTQDDAMHDIVITSGSSHSPAASASGQSIAQELPQLFHRDILDVDEATVDEGYVRELRELISLVERGEEMLDRVGLNTEILSGSNAYDDETTDDERYFLAESELQFYPFSDHRERRHLDKSEPTQEFVYSSIRKSKRGTKQNRTTRKEAMEIDNECWISYQKNDDNTLEQSSLEQGATEPKSQDFPSQPTRHLTKPTQSFVHSSIRKSNSGAKHHRTPPGESTEADGVFWRRGDIASEQSSLEKGVPEPKRRWYRSKKMRPEDLRSPRKFSEIFLPILAIISILIVVCVFIFLFWIHA